MTVEDMANQKKDILLLVDGNALIHRGFHAIPHLSNKKGEPTNGVYGFAMLFLRALKELCPKYVVATFDLPKPTFRDELYKEYKAKRVKAPVELYQQIPRVKELVRAFNVPIFEKEGFEADDLIGTLSELAKKQDHVEIVILTGDLDTLQLVDDTVKVYAPKQGLTETKLYDRQAVEERYGLTPEQMLDYKALRGDPSDNIPGVPGIGEKTATDLLKKFGTLEGIYAHQGEGIKPRVLKLLNDYKKEAELSKKLAQIVRDVKINFVLQDAETADYDEQKVFALFQELGFKSLLEKLPKSNGNTPSLNPSPQGGGKDIQHELIDTKDKYKKFIAELKKQKEFAFDTETTSTNPIEAKLLGMGFCWREGQAYYVVAELVDKELEKILADEHTKKIGHNIKYDLLVLRSVGIELRGLSFDTMIAAYLLNPGSRSFSLDALSFSEFGFRKTKITDLIGEGRNQLNMSQVSVQKVSDYCCEDVDYTWRLKARLEQELKKMRLTSLFHDIEMPLIPVLASMEWAGIKIDSKILKELSDEAETEADRLQKKIWKLAGEEFNIGSPTQLKKILFEKLEIPTDNLKRGKTGLSTAATELEKLRGLHPVVDLIFDWRELTKLQNTYLDALPQLVNKETKRVHTSFNQTITATGRLSSSDPNLQNIPIRTELGRQVRKAFVAEKGFELLAVDYSQIELRLAAHLSGDKKMIKIFRAGGDIHEATAKEIFGTNEVSADQRRAAKTINFGVLYGLSAYGLKNRIVSVSQGSAEDFIEKYFETFSGVKKYIDEVIAATKQTGLVKNELGRVRLLPEINSSQFLVRSAAERAAINMPMQSLASDIIKLAMNKLAEKDLIDQKDCRLLLQVHDELVFEVREGKENEYAEKIVKIMESAYKLKIPLVTEAKVGENWHDMNPVR